MIKEISIISHHDHAPSQDYTGDKEAIIACLNCIFPHVGDEFIQRIVLEANTTVYAKDLDNKIHGVSLAREGVTESNFGPIKVQHLSATGVLPSSQGMGIGRQLGQKRVLDCQPNIFYTTSKNAGVAKYIEQLSGYNIINDPNYSDFKYEKGPIVLEIIRFLMGDKVNGVDPDFVRRAYMHEDPTGEGVGDHKFYKGLNLQSNDGLLIVGIQTKLFKILSS